MSRKNLLFILLGVGMAATALLFFMLWLLSPIGVQTKDLHVKVDEYVGINLDHDKIYFGTVAPGATGRRDMTISAEKGAYVTLRIEGPIAPWVQADKTAFSLAPGMSEKIIFSVAVPADASFGNYTGTVYVQLYRRGAARFFE